MDLFHHWDSSEESDDGSESNSVGVPFLQLGPLERWIREHKALVRRFMRPKFNQSDRDGCWVRKLENTVEVGAGFLSLDVEQLGQGGFLETHYGPFLRFLEATAPKVTSVVVELPPITMKKLQEIARKRHRWCRFLGRSLNEALHQLKGVSIVTSGDTEGAAILLENLNNITHLELRVSNVHNLSYEYCSLALSLKSLHRLEVLYFVGDDGASDELYQTILRAIPSLSSLISLQLANYDGDGDNQNGNNADGLRAICCGSLTLREIIFNNCRFNFGDCKAISESLRRNPRIEAIELGPSHMDYSLMGNFVDPEGKMLLAGNLHTLTKLSIPALHDIQFYETLATSLRNNNNLKFLAITHWGGGDCNLEISQLGLAKVLDSLENNHCLEGLHLMNFYWGETSSGATGKYLSVTSSLKSLRITSTSAQTFVWGPAWRRIYRGLAANTSLTAFYVDLNQYMTAKEVGEGVLFLNSNTTLKELNISVLQLFGRLPEDYFIECLKNLRLNKSIKVLNACSVDVRNEKHPIGISSWSAQALLDICKQNYTICKCPFKIANEVDEGDGIGKLIEYEINCVLRLNSHGRNYITDKRTNSKEKGVALLEKVIDDVYCIYMHLRENPNLCNNCRQLPGAGKRKRRNSNSP